MNTVPFPKAAEASEIAACRPDPRYFSLDTKRIPRPPPPAVALMTTGRNPAEKALIYGNGMGVLSIN